MSSGEGPRSRVWAFDDFALGVVYLTVLTLAALSPAQADVWWLLRAGKDIWHTGSVPTVDHYSFTANGRYWPNHEWLWEAIAYPLHLLGGMPLLTLASSLAALGAVVVARRTSAARGYAVPAVLLACAVPLSTIWTTRPQVTSLMLLALLNLLIVRGRLLLIPPLFLLWANLHGQVALGGLSLGAATLLALVLFGVERSAAARRRARNLVLTSAASALLTLCTPLGPRLWSYVLGANGRPGQQDIAEWHSAFHITFLTGAFWLLVVAMVVGVWWHRDRLRTWRTLVPLVSALAMLPLAMMAIRNIAFFLIVAIPVLMTIFESSTGRRGGDVSHPRVKLGVVGLCAASVVASLWVAAPKRLGWHPVPTDLAHALEGCPGHLYNDYDTGAPLIWWVPRVKVFIDNRQDPYPAAVMQAGMKLTPKAVHAVFARYEIRCAYLVRGSKVVPVLHREGWQTTYAGDGTLVLAAP